MKKKTPKFITVQIFDYTYFPPSPIINLHYCLAIRSNEVLNQVRKSKPLYGLHTIISYFVTSTI